MAHGQDKTDERKVKSTAILPQSLLTGFVGGMLNGVFGVLMYKFNFSEVAPRMFMLRPWTRAAWIDSWLGDVISVIMIGVLSIIVAYIYYGLFKKVKSLWFSAAFGVVIWGLLFYVFHPIFPFVPTISALEPLTIVSTICLFLVYGVFIGFSISYDYADTVLKAWPTHH